MSAVVSSWAAKDAHGAAEWVSALSGPERERSAGTLALALAEKYPRETLEWVMTISDPMQRTHVAAQAARLMAIRDPAAARQWVEAAPFTAEMKAQLQSSFERAQTGAPQ